MGWTDDGPAGRQRRPAQFPLQHYGQADDQKSSKTELEDSHPNSPRTRRAFRCHTGVSESVGTTRPNYSAIFSRWREPARKTIIMALLPRMLRLPLAGHLLVLQ